MLRMSAALRVTPNCTHVITLTASGGDSSRTPSVNDGYRALGASYGPDPGPPGSGCRRRRTRRTAWDSMFFDKTFDPYWCRFGGQDGLPFESLQTSPVYFAKIFEVQWLFNYEYTNQLHSPRLRATRRRWQFATVTFLADSASLLLLAAFYDRPRSPHSHRESRRLFCDPWYPVPNSKCLSVQYR